MSKRLFETRVNSEKDLEVINMWVAAEVMEVLRSSKEAEQTKRKPPRTTAPGI